MKTINMLIEYAQDQAEYIFPREMLESALFFNISCAMGLRNIRIERNTNNGTKTVIPNYYGITFIGSGAGKNYSRDLTRNMVNWMNDIFESKMESFISSRRDQDGKIPKQYINLPNYYIPITSSVEGLQKAAQTICDMNYGSVNVVNDEIGDFILKSENIFTKLKTAWDDGISEGQVNASDGNENYFTVKDIHYNAMLFGSPQPFDLDEKKKDRLIETYVSGMARRSYIYHNSSYKKSENRNLNFEMMEQEQIQLTKDYLDELFSFIKNHSGKIKFPNEIRKKLIQYDIQKEILREASNSIIAEDLGSIKKIEKLLGIIATLDLSEEISEEHLHYAIDFTERMDNTAADTVEIKPLYIKVYNELEKRNFTARTDLMKAVKGLTSKALDETMELVIEHANMLGNTIVEKEYSGIKKYKLEKLSKTSLSRVILSTNANMDATASKGFEKKEGDFFNIHKVICSNSRYSAGTFLNGHITNDNYLPEQNLFIIDVDEGLTISDARELFSDYVYMIATTRSHQKEKNGEICDRFRLIFPTSSSFHLEPSIYSEMYMNVLGAIGMHDADIKCKNPSRWYYGFKDAEYWYNEKGDLLDIRMFIPDTSMNQHGKKNLENYEDNLVPDNYRIDGALRWFFANTSSGNRNDNLFKLGMLIKDKIGSDQWELWTRKANDELYEPLKDREINSVIKSLSRR